MAARRGPSDGRPRILLVLEQTLGHVAHARNLERTLAREDGVDGEVIRISYREVAGPMRRTPLGTWSFQASLAARRQLQARLRAGPVDAIFVHTQVASLFCAGILRIVPGVISLDATPANLDLVGEAYGHRRGPPWLESVKRRLVERALASAAALISWCRWAADSLVADYGIETGRILVLPPGVDVDLFRPAPPRARGGLRVLFVGGQFERKGGGDVLQAMRGLPGAELDLVTGAEVRGVPADLRCRVHRGLTPQSPELVRLYREADVFVLPSRGDCLPQAVAEAMACGLPVVATPVGAIPELVEDGDNGILVPPGDPRALRAALEALAASPERRRAMGRRGRQRAEREHDAVANNRRIFALLRELAARGSPRAARVAAGAPP